MTHFDHLIRTARGQGFDINLNNFEIEIYRPGATVSAVFNRNDPAQVKAAQEYILERFKQSARAEQDAVKRGRVAGLW